MYVKQTDTICKKYVNLLLESSENVRHSHNILKTFAFLQMINLGYKSKKYTQITFRVSIQSLKKRFII